MDAIETTFCEIKTCKANKYFQLLLDNYVIYRKKISINFEQVDTINEHYIIVIHCHQNTKWVYSTNVITTTYRYRLISNIPLYLYKEFTKSTILYMLSPSCYFDRWWLKQNYHATFMISTKHKLHFLQESRTKCEHTLFLSLFGMLGSLKLLSSWLNAETKSNHLFSKHARCSQWGITNPRIKQASCLMKRIKMTGNSPTIDSHFSHIKIK